MLTQLQLRIGYNMNINERINLLDKLKNYFPHHEAIQAVTYLNELQHKLNDDEYSGLINSLLSGNTTDIEQLINSKLYTPEQLDMDPAEPKVDPYRAALDYNILQYRRGFNGTLNRAKEAFNNAIKAKYGPTGIVNPADYMSSVTKTEEDTNGDGNIDIVTYW